MSGYNIMAIKSWIRSGWFWTIAFLLGVTLAVYGYTWSLRNAVEQLVQEQLEAARELVAILKSVRQAEDMDDAWAKILAHHRHGQALEARFRDLPKPSVQLQQQLRDRYGAEFQNVVAEFNIEKKRIEVLPGGKDFCANLDQLSQSSASRLAVLGPLP
jgi:hypothetical protein